MTDNNNFSDESYQDVISDSSVENVDESVEEEYTENEVVEEVDEIIEENETDESGKWKFFAT